MNLVYSQDAVDDLTRLRDFIAAHNPAAAARVAADLISKINHVRDFPEIGRPVAQAPDPNTIRDLIAGKYVVRYAAREETLIILRIWHHFEDRGSST